MSLCSGLSCPTSSSGSGFCSPRSPPPPPSPRRRSLDPFYGSDQITSRAEAFYPEKCGFPLHRVGGVRGLEVTTSGSNTVRYHVCSSPPPFSPRLPTSTFFSWFNTWSSQDVLRFALARATISLTNGIPAASGPRKRDAEWEERSFNLFRFSGGRKTFSFTLARVCFTRARNLTTDSTRIN